MTYLVVILLPEELSQITQRLQYKFQSSRWHIALPPHITFLYQPGVDEKKIIAAIEAVCRKTLPISISIHGLGQFKRKDICIYAKVEKTPAVQTFYNLMNSPFSLNEKREFTPHVTLSNRLPKGESLSVYAALKREGIVGSFLATEAVLYRRASSQSSWELVKAIPFTLDTRL